MKQNRINGHIKFCFVMPKTYPLFNPEVNSVFGGAEVDLYYLSTELAKDDRFDVSFIVADYGQDDVESNEDVAVIKSLNFKENAFAGAIKVWHAMKKADADIYMLKTASPGVPLAKLFCLIYKKVFTYRTAHRRECDGTYLKEHWLLGKGFLWAVRRARVVFAQNQADAELLEKTANVKSIVIPNGHRFCATPTTEKDCILWVGRTVEFKKPKLFLELAKKFPAEKFVMICQQATGDDRYEEFVAVAETIDNLQFHRRVDFHRIDEYFARAKVLVNTSDTEGFPNTFIQACKAATPILSLNVNPDDFLDKYGCGVCCDGDMDKMTEQLKVLAETQTGAEMGASARKYVEQTHDIAKIIAQYKELFGAMVK
jgi:glycosyltransferase involved in cell wall biosynthesis